MPTAVRFLGARTTAPLLHRLQVDSVSDHAVAVDLVFAKSVNDARQPPRWADLPCFIARVVSCRAFDTKPRISNFHLKPSRCATPAVDVLQPSVS